MRKRLFLPRRVHHNFVVARADVAVRHVRGGPAHSHRVEREWFVSVIRNVLVGTRRGVLRCPPPCRVGDLRDPPGLDLEGLLAERRQLEARYERWERERVERDLAAAGGVKRPVR